MDEELMAGRFCIKCDETIWRDGTCGCTEDEDLEEIGVKLYEKLVADDRRDEAELIRQGELEAKFEMLLEDAWQIQNGLAFVESQARKAGK